MRCQNCGRELKNGARFCIACGAQHDENGQLVGGGNQASNQGGNQGNFDYNKTMMVGSTGFKQYSEADNAQSFNQYDYANVNMGTDGNVQNTTAKKKISPILIICPIIIVVALLVSLLGGKSKKATKKIASSQNETTIAKEENSEISEPTKETQVIATVSIATESEPKEIIHLRGYWSADADYFYIDGEMQKNMWVEDYYVGSDGKKVTNDWIDNKYYVDATGKKARNEWIEFSFYGEDGQKKLGFYYVDKDGLKVTNTTVDGRYLDEVGCYWPNAEDKKQNTNESTEVKETDKKKASDKEIKKDAEHETTIVQTTIRETTTVKPVVNTQNTTIVVPENTVQNVNQQVNNTKTVASDGKSVAYQIVSTSYPTENISKYDSIVINDNNYPNLAVSIKEWNDNSSRNGIKPGETVLNANITITYDIQVERNDNKVFSFYVTRTRLDNNVAYDKEKTGYTWDVTSGQLLELNSIFNGDEKISDFAVKVVNKIKSAKNSIDSEVYDEIIAEDPEEILSNCTWYMTNTGITTVFNRNKIGNDGINGLSFNLTYSDSGNGVNKLLLTKYRK